MFIVNSISSNEIIISGTGTGGTDSNNLNESISINDKVLLINVQGDTSRVGVWEICDVKSVLNNVITCLDGISNIYGITDNTDLTGQKVRIQRIPIYNSITITNGGNLTASSWDGSFGGILYVMSLNDILVDNGGSITLSYKGYLGGIGGTSSYNSRKGESINGIGVYGRLPNYGGGGSGKNSHIGGPGGGGGYATSGLTGYCSGHFRCNYTTVGQGGYSYGVSDLSKTFLGSGGGGRDTTDYRNGTNGGNGGGIIYVNTNSNLTINTGGTIYSNGQSSSNVTSRGPGGAGAGGSIYLSAENILLDGSIEAIGGSRGYDLDSRYTSYSGNGSDGIIRLD